MPTTRASWRTAGLLGAATVACWVVPLVRGHGPYGGHYKLSQIALGTAAALAWMASLAVALTPPARRRPLAFRLAAALGALALAVPLADAAATLWSVRVGHLWYYSLSFPRAHNEPDPELVWRRKPGLSWRGRKTPDCEEVAYRADEHGFRNPPGIDRADVVVIGDSVTEAGEVPEEATFVRGLGTATGLTTVNLGTSGYGPQQELAVLRRFGLSYRPRLVVWQVTEWNDLQDAQMYARRHEPAARILPPWKVLHAQHSPLVKLVAWLLPPRRPNSVRFVASDGRVEARAFWPYTPDLHRRLPEGFAETSRAIATAFDLCRARGIEFVVLYVPSHVRVLLPALRFRDEAERDRFCPGGVADRDDDFAHALAAFCRGRGCPLIDMAPPLRRRAAVDNRRLYVRNDPHLDVDGHDAVREELARFVAARPGVLAAAARGRAF